MPTSASSPSSTKRNRFRKRNDVPSLASVWSIVQRALPSESFCCRATTSIVHGCSAPEPQRMRRHSSLHARTPANVVRVVVSHHRCAAALVRARATSCLHSRKLRSRLVVAAGTGPETSSSGEPGGERAYSAVSTNCQSSPSVRSISPSVWRRATSRACASGERASHSPKEGDTAAGTAAVAPAPLLCVSGQSKSTKPLTSEHCGIAMKASSGVIEPRANAAPALPLLSAPLLAAPTSAKSNAAHSAGRRTRTPRSSFCDAMRVASAAGSLAREGMISGPRRHRIPRTNAVPRAISTAVSKPWLLSEPLARASANVRRSPNARPPASAELIRRIDAASSARRCSSCAAPPGDDGVSGRSASS